MWDKNVLGERLRKLRRSKRLTQFEFGEMIDASVNAISNWENGKAYPELRVLCDVCNVFSLTPNELLYNEDEKEN